MPSALELPRNLTEIVFEPKGGESIAANFYVTDQRLAWSEGVAIVGVSTANFYLVDPVDIDSLPVGLVGTLMKQGQEFKVTILEWRLYPNNDFYPCFVGQITRRIYSY
jgi:hypothetical protein